MSLERVDITVDFGIPKNNPPDADEIISDIVTNILNLFGLDEDDGDVEITGVGVCLTEIRWGTMERDLATLSQKYPGAWIEADVYGGGYGEYWKVTANDGRAQDRSGHIEYEPVDMTKAKTAAEWAKS